MTPIDNKAPREFDELQFIIDSIRPVNTGKDSVEPLLKIQLEQIKRNLSKAYDKLQSRIEKCEGLLEEVYDHVDGTAMGYKVAGKINQYFAEVESE